MEIRGEHRIDAPREVVWALLLDPAVLRECLPGCERFEPAGDRTYAVTMRLGVSELGPSSHGTARIVEEQRPSSYRLLLSGDGSTGRINGDATVALDESGGGTLVRYRCELRARSILARMGMRLLGSAAKPKIAQFFRALEYRAAAAGDRPSG